ncbi:hypothetical protein [Nonomuraea turcica]|uniref:hypothetical protein n=1 Tax=Nonomuraea sp. G32 TaxID=3067274 RepID=UPI00273B65CE|nr:hypothetical protein [Nonomuraea sp. G32]MDP4501069.1 hypothetical protein [Nonomuraea sp. G32]
MPLQTSPCAPWPIEPCCDIPDGMDEAEVERWRLVASQILFRLSGRRYGPSCALTIRPCGRSCVEQLFPAGWSWLGPQSGGRVPYLGADGVWRNAVCGCRTDCSCTELCELVLDGPVFDILEVVVDGVMLPPEAYRVDSPNRLVRLDGDCWAACQDLSAPPTEPGTAAVTYRIGLPLDESAIAAASELFCHLVRGCGGSGSCGCRMPANTTKVQRQGVTVEMADLAEIYADGRTGIPGVDLWIRSVNPYGLASPSRVLSPDLPTPRTHQWP